MAGITGGARVIGGIADVGTRMLSLAHNFLFIHIPKTAGHVMPRARLSCREGKRVLRGSREGG